ncbi:pimeloyl-ACP methyl ester carboxylesterase [Agromyces cerinus]|uniref:alpha/beta fold hydrolase n=1 Tax=Agromyces cerinus TaxID=33878 RepID=UPI00195E0FA6|nr:alpha/beta hydrolase [Agromyces cerinus]MBM7832732.1 pimeloyl-ACP methyl ester carboxylesterase [Agromyces cerinus]
MSATCRLEPLRHVETTHLDVAYFEAGPEDGQPVLLLHGFPYDIHSYVDVAPSLAAAGFRVIVPYLRGHGDTRFRTTDVPRSGQQAALGQDVIELMDALRIPEAILAGYDWGGRAACVVAALRPERVTALVSVNGYLIQDISASLQPIRPELEAGFWYFFYFLTERGRAGLTENRRGIAEVIWRRNSPDWDFDDAELDRAASAFDNPDFVDVVIHSYRHRLFHVPGAPEYSRLEAQLAQLPSITVPAITLDGLADGNFPARDAATAGARFVGPHEHRQVPHAGHNLPQEAPLAFGEAVHDAAALAARRPAA